MCSALALRAASLASSRGMTVAVAARGERNSLAVEEAGLGMPSGNGMRGRAVAWKR